jgi:aspartate aminotransferase
MEFAVAQSFSKNFGLYGERVGALHVVARSPDSAAKVEAKLKKIQRAEITSTPSFGAKIVATIVQDATLREQWHQDMRTMSGRLQDMRKRLHAELIKRSTPGNWDHLLTDVGLRSINPPSLLARIGLHVGLLTGFTLQQIGMFSMTGLSPEQVANLRDKFHVYLLPSGRLAVPCCK